MRMVIETELMKARLNRLEVLRVPVLLLICLLCSMNVQGQEIKEGSYCLTYFPQPEVETYMDSLANYLSDGFADENGNLDSVTQDYIDHFTTVPIRKMKCVYFTSDTVMISERVGDEITASYMVIPSENILLSRRGQSLMAEPYRLEQSDSMGIYDFFINEDPDDVINIEGFPCYRMDIKEVYYPPGGAAPREKDYKLYVTKEIDVPGAVILGNNMTQLIPAPLQIEEPLNNRVTIKYRASGLQFKLAPNSLKL